MFHLCSQTYSRESLLPLHQGSHQGSLHPRRASRMGRDEGRTRRQPASNESRRLGGFHPADYAAGRPSFGCRHALADNVNNIDDYNDVIFRGRQLVEEGCHASSASPTSFRDNDYDDDNDAFPGTKEKSK